jgi:hypothetical protein
MKQIPTKRNRTDEGCGSGEYGNVTSTDYLDRHAEEWRPPFGVMHLHLIYARTIHWRVVDRASSVCKISGRCYRVNIMPILTSNARRDIADHVKNCASRVYPRR